ncbi:MAG: hypothetical protein KDC46_01135 [Thermoleophilia bacterium]|nr:hypothetical protein [Thermoleophilia bacterium]
MQDVNLEFLGWLVVVCAALIAVSTLLRSAIARTSTGRLAQLRFRRLHGDRVVELLGGRLDPRRGSPWIDTYLDGRRVQLVAAPLDGAMQAGVLLLEHEIPANVWHTDGAADELEPADGIDAAALAAVVTQLRELRVDSVTCGAAIDSDPRPPHLLRMRFDGVDDLPARFEAVAPLLARLEALHRA